MQETTTISHGQFVESEQTRILDEYGAFFAFGNDQFEEQRKEGVKYTSMGYGLIAPKENADNVWRELGEIHDKGKKMRIEQEGIENIIRYELANHECYYTGDIEPAWDVLEEFGATYDQVIKIYREEYPKQEF